MGRGGVVCSAAMRRVADDARRRKAGAGAGLYTPTLLEADVAAGEGSGCVGGGAGVGVRASRTTAGSAAVCDLCALARLANALGAEAWLMDGGCVSG
jgi:hypothetical protein